MGTRGVVAGCRGRLSFSALGLAPSWHLVCARSGPSSLRPGVGAVAAHAAPYPATSSCCFWRSGPRIASRYSWRTTTLRGSVAVPLLDSEVGGKPRGRIFIWPNMDYDDGNRTSASAVPLPPASAAPPASANPQPPHPPQPLLPSAPAASQPLLPLAASAAPQPLPPSSARSPAPTVPLLCPRILIFSSQQQRLSALSPFQRREGCDRMGRVSRCDKLRDGGIEVEFLDSKEAERALSATHFICTIKTESGKQESKIPISVSAHRTKNSAQGVIFCADLEGMSNEDIADGLAEFGVMTARRILSKKNGAVVPTHSVVLTFNSVDLPKEVTVGYLKVKVRPYTPSPMRCFRCLRFGHTRDFCKNRATCGRCAATDHTSSDCTAETLRCINCDASQTPHDAFDLSCPELLREKEIMALKVSERLTFREARDRYNATHPKRSYASVARTVPTQPVQHRPEQSNITQLIALLQSFGLQVISSPSVTVGQSKPPAPPQGATATTQTSPPGHETADGPYRDRGWTLVQRSPRTKKVTPPVQSPPVPPRPAGAAARGAIRRNEEKQVNPRPAGSSKDTRSSAGSVPASALTGVPRQEPPPGAGPSPMGPPPTPPPPPSLPQRQAPKAPAVADSRPPPMTPPSAPRNPQPPAAPGRPTKRTLPWESSPTESGSPRSRRMFQPGATGRASSADGRPRQGHPRVFYSGGSASGAEEHF